jgi:hypothetical protein
MMLNAKELSSDQKLAIEALLGRPVSENEMVSIRAFELRAVSAQRRQEIAEELRRIFAEVDAKRQPVSAQEADDIVNEAMRSSRPHYRPHQ